jgi:hypothetical protein
MNKMSDDESLDNFMLTSNDLNDLFDEFIYAEVSPPSSPDKKLVPKKKSRVIVMDKEIEKAVDND